MADKEKKTNQFELLGKKIVKFFVELKSELKKVVWPDRKKLTQSTITVVMICLFAAVLIFSVDKILTGVLNAVKFYPSASVSTTVADNLIPTTAVTKPANSTGSTSTVSTSSVASASVSSVSSAVTSTAVSSTVSAS